MQIALKSEAIFNISCIIICLVALGQFSNTLYIPSLPHIQAALHTNKSLISLTLTFSMIAFGVSQFIYGPLSDVYGRKPLLVIGITIFIIGSIICLFSQNIYILILGRISQGAGIGCVGAIARAILKDTFTGKTELLKYTSYIVMCTAITPAISPLIGGEIQHYFSWHTNFSFLIIFGTLLLITVLKNLPETNERSQSETFSIKYFLLGYLQLLNNRPFMGYAFINMLGFGGEILFLSAASFILQKKLGLTPIEFGSIVIFLVPFVMLGSFLISKLSQHFTAQNLCQTGILISLSGGIGMLLIGYLTGTHFWGILIPMMIFAFGEGMSTPASSAGAMMSIVNKSGFAGSMMGGIAMIGAGIIVSSLSLHKLDSQLPLGFMLCILDLLAIFSLLLTIKRSS